MRPRPTPLRALRRRGSGRTPNRGIALMLVLWVLALLTVMALGLTMVQRSEGTLTRNQLDGARFRALAEAAIALTAMNLLAVPLEMQDADSGAFWVPDGTPRTLIFDGEEISVRLFNEASRIDLNQATPEQLTALIELALGGDDADLSVDPVAVAQLVDAIQDWRDADDLTHLSGAEDAEYLAAGRPFGARDGPFESVLELRQVLGMTGDLYRRLAPDLTVDNDSGQVDLTFASAPVLIAVQGLTPEDAELAIVERNQPVVPGAEQARLLNRGGPLYRLRVTHHSSPTARRTMEALVRIERGGYAQYDVLWQRFGLYDNAPPDPDRATDLRPTP